MSKFFEALEQAERDRALRKQGTQPEPVAERTETPTASGSAAASGSGPAEREQAVPSGFARHGTRAGSLPTTASTTAPELEVESTGQVDGHLVSLLAPTAFGAEQYRAIRHFIEEQHKSEGVTVVAVTSPGADDGKTTTAINLAGALAQAPAARVLLIEADLRRPSLLKNLGLDSMNGPGLVDLILQPGLSLESAVLVCAPFNLAVVAAGKPPSATYEVLKSPRLGELFEEARHGYDYVIVDTPPLCPIPDGRVVVKWVDGVLLVAAAHKTPRRLVEEALELLPVKPTAIVFNGDDRASADYYGYGNGHHASRWARLVRRQRSQ